VKRANSGKQEKRGTSRPYDPLNPKFSCERGRYDSYRQKQRCSLPPNVRGGLFCSIPQAGHGREQMSGVNSTLKGRGDLKKTTFRDKRVVDGERDSRHSIPIRKNHSGTNRRGDRRRDRKGGE